MGTSSNQASPGTPSWKLANAILGIANMPSELQSRELWRAAAADASASLADSLGSPVVARIVELADMSRAPAEALYSFERVMLDTKSAGLMLDLAKRALIRAVAARAGAEGFASELFGEVAGYYVSRDLPSFTASPGRVGTISESIALKDSLRAMAGEIARTQLPSKDRLGWRAYVEKVLEKLQRGGR